MFSRPFVLTLLTCLYASTAQAVTTTVDHGVQSSVSDTQIRLRWNEWTAEPIVYYLVRVKETGTTLWTSSQSTKTNTGIVFTSMTPETEYTFDVRAYVGNSTYYRQYYQVSTTLNPADGFNGSVMDAETKQAILQQVESTDQAVLVMFTIAAAFSVFSGYKAGLAR